MIWRFSDGRRGHDSQSLGLCDALQRLTDCVRHDIPAPSALPCIAAACRRRFAPGAALPDPALLVGAGRAVQIPMLCARRARGGLAIVLMRPSLPVDCFDLCLIPEHDHPAVSPHVIATRGPLTPIRPAPKHPGSTLILVGGPSRHFTWDEPGLLQQIRKVCAASTGPCAVFDSPRTPASTRRALQAPGVAGADFVPLGTAAAAQLHARLAGAQTVWISADSISMIHEALGAGAAVGILELPRRRRSRVADAVAALVRGRSVTPFGAWESGAPLSPPAHVPDEAGRCAALILGRLGRAAAYSRNGQHA